MALRIFNDEPERIQTRWLIIAALLALLLHGGAAGAFHLYKITGLQVPNQHTPIAGPFTIKQVEINPKDLKTDEPDPTRSLPAPQALKNPAEFNVDPSLVEKALQTPQPLMRPPTLPAPTRVVAAADLTQSAPYMEADNAKITADISKMQPIAPASDPLASTAKMAQNLISSSAGTVRVSRNAGVLSANADGAGNVPGFGDLPPAPPPDMQHLPEPVLLRLPADVLFDFNSADLKPDATPLLQQAADMIAKYPDASVTVDGYSDSFGDKDYNQTLSQQRAQAVQDWLQGHASNGTYHFKSQGHGATDFVVSSALSKDAQGPNRRVELVVQALKPQ